MNTQKYSLIAVDIAKDSLQIQTRKANFRVPNNLTGHRKLLKHIAIFSRPLVVCEATGGYERALVAQLHEHQVSVAMVNPARVRHFAKSEGLKCKTDPIDARMLYRFGEEKKLQPRAKPDPVREELAALLDRRSHLSEQLGREKNRLQKSPASIARSIKRMIRCVENEISEIDSQIETLINQEPALKEKVQRLQSIKGVGKITAWTTLAYLSEIETLSRNKVVALAGLAPYNYDSGNHTGKRSIFAGRAKVRKALYMAAKTAKSHNSVIKPYFDEQMARGKPYQCTMVAVMRKLLLHMRSLLTNPQPSLAS